ncbi:MAG: CARDB domain-containing protein [Nitrospirota bacterium]
MKEAKLFILILIILSLAIAMTGCGEGMDQGTSEVTIIISDNQTASLDIKKPAILALIKHRLKKIIDINEASALPAGIADIRYTISGPGMSAMTGIANISGDTVRIVVYVPNGNDRVFTLDARYSNKCVRYRGAREVDLNGSPTKMGITMNLVSVDLCPSNATSNVTSIYFTINNSGNNAVSNVFYYVQYQSVGVDRCSSGTAAVTTPIPADGSVAASASGIYPTSNNYRIIIDPLNAITETDDSNNEICSGTFCTSPPPLSIC